MTMRYLSFILAALVLCPWSTTQAQVVVWKKGQKSISDSLAELSKDGEQPTPRYDWEGPRKLRLTPAAEPTPALKHRFWVPPVERQPGDVKSHVDRVIIMNLQHDQRQELSKEYEQISTEIYGLQEVKAKLTDGLLVQIREYLGKQAEVMKQLHYALSLDTVHGDYALRDLRGNDVYTYNMANIQSLRNLARLLQLECQLAVAEGRYEDAIASLCDGYRVAELALRSGEGTIVGQLVSIAIVGMVNSGAESMAQQANSPNLYWALASLPSEQLFSIRAAFEGESIAAIHALFPWDVKQPASSEAQAAQRLGELIKLAASVINGNPQEFDETALSQHQALAALSVVLFTDRARQELGEPQLGNCQAVLEWAQSDFIRLRDEIFKWMLLPVQERRVYGDRVESSMQFLGGRIPDSPGMVLGGLILPAVQAADAAAQRTQRQHAFLITLEALRAYAAEHNGELPESLENLYPLPAWSDPTTGKPFTYRRTDPKQAVLITEKSIGLPNEFHIEMVVP